MFWYQSEMFSSLKWLLTALDLVKANVSLNRYGSEVSNDILHHHEIPEANLSAGYGTEFPVTAKPKKLDFWKYAELHSADGENKCATLKVTGDAPHALRAPPLRRREVCPREKLPGSWRCWACLEPSPHPTSVSLPASQPRKPKSTFWRVDITGSTSRC